MKKNTSNSEVTLSNKEMTAKQKQSVSQDDSAMKKEVGKRIGTVVKTKIATSKTEAEANGWKLMCKDCASANRDRSKPYDTTGLSKEEIEKKDKYLEFTKEMNIFYNYK